MYLWAQQTAIRRRDSRWARPHSRTGPNSRPSRPARRSVKGLPSISKPLSRGSNPSARSTTKPTKARSNQHRGSKPSKQRRQLARIVRPSTKPVSSTLPLHNHTAILNHLSRASRPDKSITRKAAKTRTVSGRTVETGKAFPLGSSSSGMRGSTVSAATIGKRGVARRRWRASSTSQNQFSRLQGRKALQWWAASSPAQSRKVNKRKFTSKSSVVSVGIGSPKKLQTYNPLKCPT